MAALFKPNQIVCLDSESASVYGEVIQVVELRNLCWVRPIFIVMREENSNLFDSVDLRNLNSVSDLLLPTSLFRNCFDTELIPLLGKYQKVDDREILEPKIASETLHRFIKELWKLNQDKFS